mmetsp:Transcript_9114/g.14501  ORF Transcript_9114/g.14501 Transcript_9114/m.14501 type:complete len:372 (-) Transcript_9114:1083-2198(-)
METSLRCFTNHISALRGLKQLNRALEAYSTSYFLTKDTSRSYDEYKAAVTDITRLMTREQLAEYIVSVLNDYELKGLIQPPREQNVSDNEKREAMFCHIREWHREGHKSQRDYCTFVAKLALKPMSIKLAYLQRACMYKEALCFKQVVMDAQAAIKQCGSKNGTTDSISSGDEHSDDGMAKTILANPGTPNPFEKRTFLPRAWGWFLQGLGFKATKISEEQDLIRAAKCLKIATKLDQNNIEYRSEFDEICSQLNHIQMNEVLNDANEQKLISELGLPAILAEAAAESKKPLCRILGCLRFERDSLALFGADARKSLKESLAASAEVEARDVLIESVSIVVDKESTRNLQITFQIHLGPQRAKGKVRSRNS